MKIIEYYTVCTQGNYKEFNREVNERIKAGFQPIGGVSTCADSEVLFFTQAMVRYDGTSADMGAAVG